MSRRLQANPEVQGARMGKIHTPKKSHWSGGGQSQACVPCKTARPGNGGSFSLETSQPVGLQNQVGKVNSTPAPRSVCDPREAFPGYRKRIKGQPHVELASLETPRVGRHPIQPGGGTDHVSVPSFTRQLFPEHLLGMALEPELAELTSLLH